MVKLILIMEKLNIKKYCKILFLLTIVLMESCVTKTLPEVLTGGSFRYWLFIDGISSSPADSVYNLNRTTRKDSFQLYFDKTGLFMVYFGDYKSFDYYYTPKWKITNDSILEILHRDYVVKQVLDNQVLISTKIPKTGSVVVDTLEAIDINEVPKEYRKYRKLPPPPKGMLIL